MFIRTKKSTNLTAIQIVKSIRLGNKISQKIVAHVGSASNDDTTGINNLKELAKIQLNHLLYSDNSLFPISETISNRVQCNAGQVQETIVPSNKETLEQDNTNSKDQQNEELYHKNPLIVKNHLVVDLDNCYETQRVSIGMNHIFTPIFDGLQFNTILGKSKKRDKIVTMLRHLVISRIARPASKRASTKFLSEYYDIHYNVNKVYDMLDYLDDNAIRQINKLSFQYGKTLLNNEIKVVFYDCTTLYFESFTEDDLKVNGFSKDGKFNQPQVLLCLIVGANGIPLGYELFPGNCAEGHTLEKALEKLRQDFQIKEVIFVADAGLLSNENKLLFKSKNQLFVVGARLKNMSKKIQQQILNLDNYKTLTTIQKKGHEDEIIKHQEIALPDGTRLIVTHSTRRAKKDKADRQKAIEKLRSKIKKYKSAKSMMSNRGYTKYIKLKNDTDIEINEEKITEAELWDGLKGIETNISSETLSVQDILKHYRGLWQIEETFRISKHNLRLRPIFHWTPKRIKAHIALCYMALTCVRSLENLLRLNNIKISLEDLKNDLYKVQYSILTDKLTKKRYVIPSQFPKNLQKIYKLLGVKWSNAIFELK